MPTVRTHVRRWMSGERVPDLLLWSSLFATLGFMVLLNVVNVGILHIHPVPDLLHPATPSSLADALERMSPTSRTRYLYTAWLDWLFPAAYAIALSGILARLRPPRLTALPWLPVLAMAFDLIENTFFILLVGGWLPAHGAPLYLAAGANATKWLLADLALAAVAALLFRRMVLSRTRRG